ncbi:MAG: hypothetical protein NVSMB7_00550 [Chitinophagaceae bacterium]
MQVQKLIYILLGCSIAVAVAPGCAYTKKDVVQLPCVIPDSVFYSKDVVPILQNNCYTCHSAASNSSGILLDNYNGLRLYAQNGYLYGTISHASGYRPMPDNGGKLSGCNIALIKKWIDTGTPQ